MGQIRVEYEELDSRTLRIEEARNNYQELVDELYAIIERLNETWKGEDNIAYSNQIMAFKDDMHKISMIMGQYAGFLKASSRAYKETQEEIKGRAMKLRG